MITKKNVLIFSITTAFLFFAFVFPTLSGLCSEYQGNCRDSYRNHALTILWAPFLLWISVCTSFLSKEFFARWLKFALPWVVFSYLAIYFTSTRGPIVQGPVMLVVTAILVSVSLGMMLFNFFVTQKKIDGASNEAFATFFAIVLGGLSLLLLANIW